MKKLIIIPAFNESASIESTIEEIKKCAKGFDYIVVNDCSKDNTKQVCERNNFHMLSLPINYGLTSAIQVGMKYAYQNG